MTRDDLKEQIENNLPLRIHVTDGRSFVVSHVDYVFVSPLGRYVTVYEENDRFHMIPMDKVSGVSAVDTAIAT